VKRGKRTVITVDFHMDDCMMRDTWSTRGRYNTKVHPDGRGYVKIDGTLALYAKAERIIIRDGRKA
jgi:hypothetical protein